MNQTTYVTKICENIKPEEVEKLNLQLKALESPNFRLLIVEKNKEDVETLKCIIYNDENIEVLKLAISYLPDESPILYDLLINPISSHTNHQCSYQIIKAVLPKITLTHELIITLREVWDFGVFNNCIESINK